MRPAENISRAQDSVGDESRLGRSNPGQSGGTSQRDVHGTDRTGSRGVDVDHVWQNGEMYIQSDGQIVRVLDNGNGTYDVVVRDMGNPSGAPTTVLKGATERYVNNKIENGQWE